MLDLHKIKADFADLVLQVQPWTLTQFVMWLDLKIAEFKVHGYMALDQSKRTIPRWLEDEIFDPSPPNAPNGPPCRCRNVANGSNSNDYESLRQNTNQFEISASVRQRSVSDSKSKIRPENELLSRNLYDSTDFLRLHQNCSNASEGKGCNRIMNECIEIRDDKDERVTAASTGRAVRCTNSDDNFTVVQGRGTVDINRRKQSKSSRTDQTLADSVRRSGNIHQNYETDTPECLVIPSSVSSNSVPSQSPTASRFGSVTGPRFPDRYMPDRITPILMVNNVHQPKVTSPDTQNSGNDVISIDLSASHDSLKTDNTVTADASPLNLTAGRSSSKHMMNSTQAMETSSLVSVVGSLSPGPGSLVSVVGLTTSSGSSVVSTSRPVDTFDLEEVDMKPDVKFLQECLKSVAQQQHNPLSENFEGGQNIQHSSLAEVNSANYSREDENNAHFTASSDREQMESRPHLSTKSRISLPNFDDPYLKNLLETGNAKVIWSKLVGICASHLLAQCNGQPSCADYQAFSKALYQKYPSIAMDRGPNPWSVFKKALSQKIRHTRFKMRRGFSIRDNNMRASYLLSNRYQNGRFGSSRGRRAVPFS
ncbi:hypothetical protein CHS0354_043184 [Potamilus streckersoni]|uniref:Uncharacterized protein n=1 Tax=Potamilus streckersoni TaxID=2493646 RepID=A0AAE0SNN3_9BIVA|nr:hypothetical protein CHS0354_043184 [Potamilus streckersoni]